MLVEDQSKLYKQIVSLRFTQRLSECGHLPTVAPRTAKPARSEARPWSFEHCFRSPLGSCIDIAESDCTDVPGSWWNREGKTCSEYKQWPGRRRQTGRVLGVWTCQTNQDKSTKELSLSLLAVPKPLSWDPSRTETSRTESANKTCTIYQP